MILRIFKNSIITKGETFIQLTQDELRKAQLLMLKILKEVHRICEGNDVEKNSLRRNYV